MIHYDLFEEDTCIIVKYPKNIDKDLIISFMEFVFYNIQPKKVKKLFIDFRDCKPNFEINSLEEIKNTRLKFYDGLRTVYLVNNSIETAYTVYFAENFKHINICSTIDYAMKLLDLDPAKYDLEEIISKLTLRFKK